MTRILLTYFDAFEGVPVNPTDLLAHRLQSLSAASTIELLIEKLPVTFGESGKKLQEALERYRPDALISTGVAVGRDKVSFERVAINLDDARIQDNAGKQIKDCPIVTGAPTAYFSTLPTRSAYEKARAQELPVELSYTAGTYVCNHVFYHGLHLCQKSGIPAGFVHIPAVTEVPESYALPGHKDTGGVERQAPHLPLETVAETVKILLEETAAEIA